MNTSELAELMQDRVLAYRFLARAFRTAPDAAFIESMRAASDGHDADHPLAAFFSELAEADAEQLRIDVAADYNRLFLGMSANPVAPYESVYTSDEGLLMQDARDCAVEAYRQWGLRVPNDFDLPEDHLALELDFMGQLAERTRDALESGTDAEGLLEAQRAFVEDHLCVWVPAFCDDVERAAQTSLFRGLAVLARQHVAADRETLAQL